MPSPRRCRPITVAYLGDMQLPTDVAISVGATPDDVYVSGVQVSVAE